MIDLECSSFEEVDILIVRDATKVTKAIIEGFPQLKLIGRAGTGTDNIDTEEATRHGNLVLKLVFDFLHELFSD